MLWLEVLLPKRLEEDEFASALSLLVDWSLFVVRLSLLLLQVQMRLVITCSCSRIWAAQGGGDGRTYFERRVHRLEGLLSSF